MRKFPLRVSIHAPTAQSRRFAPLLKRRVIAAHKLLPKNSLRELSIALVGDAAMKCLHRRYLRKPSTTDVLTFETDPGEGEVIICLPQAVRQLNYPKPQSRAVAARSGPPRPGSVSQPGSVPIANELLLLALHGMLHLCGFDDRTPSQYAAMHRAEDRLLCKLGIGPVFAAKRKGSPRTTEPTR